LAVLSGHQQQKEHTMPRFFTALIVLISGREISLTWEADNELAAWNQAMRLGSVLELTEADYA
jgi:hypothetical protein